MKYSSAFIALALALGLAGTATAEIKEKSGYVGASLGYAGYDKGGFDGYGKDKDGVSYGIFGGYRFNKYFALEGRYTYLGKYDLVAPGINGEKTEATYSIVSANAVGLLPLGDSNWELMGQAGIGNGRYKFSGGESANGRDVAYTLGVGVRWHIVPAFTVQLAADAYKFHVNDDGLPESKFSTEFGVIQLAGQWNF